MDRREIVFEGVDWIHVAQDRQGPCEQDNEPSGSIKCLEFRSFSRRTLFHEVSCLQRAVPLVFLWKFFHKVKIS
jgi:hypothetical protein